MSTDVLIVGGGFTGMAAAAALARSGRRVHVYEAAQTTDPRFRGELIHPRGVRGLSELGLGDELFRRGGVAVKGFAVTPKGGVGAMVLPYAAEQGPGLGMDHHQLVLTLRAQVAARKNVRITTGTRVDALIVHDARVVGVRTAGGDEHFADLVVVADGRQSKLRAQLGLEPEVKLLSHTIAFGVEGELPEGRFGHVFLGGPGPILAYPYGDGLIRFCVDVPLGAAKGREGLLKFLRERALPAVAPSLREPMLRSLEATPFEGCANHSISTTACAAPGVVLVGDAGGCAHPLTASGMTNAINDVLTLSKALADAGGEPTDEALGRYQRERYDFIRMRELFTHSLYEVFRAADDGAAALQDGVFRYWGGARGRRVSMNILSGEEVRVSRFVAEYTRVFQRSAVVVLAQLARNPGRGTAQLQRLARTTAARMGDAVGRTARKVLERYRLDLHELG